MNNKTISVLHKSYSKLRALVYAICAFLLVTCSLNCLISSFALRVDSFSLIFCTALFTGVFATFAVFVKSRRKYITCIGVIFAVFALIVLCSYGTLLAQLNYVVNAVLREYSKFLDLPEWVYFAEYSSTATQLFVSLSLLLSFFLTFALIRIQRTFFAIAIPIIIVIPCFILVNTLPDLLTLLTLITVLLTLFVSSNICRINSSQSFAVVPVVAVFMAILVTVMSVLIPVEGYERSGWQDSLLQLAQDLFSMQSHSKEVKTDVSQIKTVEKEIDLSQSGPLEQTHTKVMTVDSMYYGRVYLRGSSYANYENNKWSLLTEEQAKSYPTNFDSSLITESVVSEYTIDIETKRKEEVIYTPYFLSRTPSSGTVLFDCLVQNDRGTQKYNLNFKPCTSNELPFEGDQMYYHITDTDGADAYRDFVYENYLSVPKEVRAEMTELAYTNNFNFESQDTLVNSVREFVSNSASYSLDTPQAPQDRDFTLWFLYESDTGYCMHFATAATLMLRSMGIPARYVSGYCFDLDQNNHNLAIVTTDNAHAWVEYFDDEIGWVPLEATPGDFSVAVSSATVEETQQKPTAVPNNVPTIGTVTVDKVIRRPHNMSGVTKTVLIFFAVVISALMLSVLTLTIRRKIILYKRHKHFTTGSNNKRAKYIYKYLLILVRCADICVPEKITDIADKAWFSGKQITENELSIIIQFADKCAMSVEFDSPTMKDWYFRYVLVII